MKRLLLLAGVLLLCLQQKEAHSQCTSYATMGSVQVDSLAYLGDSIHDAFMTPSGDIYITKYFRGEIYKVAPDGTTSLFASGMAEPTWSCDYFCDGSC